MWGTIDIGKRIMKKRLFTTMTVMGAIAVMGCASAFAAGENMINSSAGKQYAGYGYTHGYVPVTTGTGGHYDNDIMKYDINNSRFYFNSPYYYTYDEQSEEADASLQRHYDENQQTLRERNGIYK